MNETKAQTEIKKKPIYTKPKFIASVVASIIFLILIFQNWDMVSVRVLFWKQPVPASLMYVVFAIAGFVAARITHRTRPRVTGSVSK